MLQAPRCGAAEGDGNGGEHGSGRMPGAILEQLDDGEAGERQQHEDIGVELTEGRHGVEVGKQDRR